MTTKTTSSTDEDDYCGVDALCPHCRKSSELNATQLTLVMDRKVFFCAACKKGMRLVERAERAKVDALAKRSKIFVVGGVLVFGTVMISLLLKWSGAISSAAQLIVSGTVFAFGFIASTVVKNSGPVVLRLTALPSDTD